MVNVFAKKIGIVGGGQLGKMMLLEAKKMGFYAAVLDPSQYCPAHSVCDLHITANFNDKESIAKLADITDVLTYEFEHIDVDILKELEAKGKKIYPSPKSLKIIQNKFSQKERLKQYGVPVPDFMKISCQEDMKKAGELFSYPYLLKTCTGGYDGKGNAVVLNKEHCLSCYDQLGGGKTPLMAEKHIDFKMEISALGCRGIDGSMVVYPIGENIHVDNILFQTKVPAAIPLETTKKAMEIAGQVMGVFDGVGMFCVEMFVDKNDFVYVNEVAPRPHNSGHYSIEGCVTSQFENHIRAVAELPLGDPSLIRPTVMINVLGEEGFKGNPIVTGGEDALKIPGVMLHIYGKEVTAPKRKMGHLTASADSMEEALQRAEDAKRFIKIIGGETI